jgi:hypothetical protein
MKKRKKTSGLILAAALGACAITPLATQASSHMDAPLLTFDPAANTTDVYAFVTESDGQKYLTTALAVYPFEEPGVGPNNYRFDDNVLYEIHVATGDNLTTGKSTVSYQFKFQTQFKNQNTIAQAYLGQIEQVDDLQQNLVQRYTVTKAMPGQKKGTLLFGNGVLPPNNQGLVTPYYNEGDSGENPAKQGVADATLLDRYTSGTVLTSTQGYKVFAGQRDDGFYGDIQSIFDLDFSFSGPNKPFDSQGGFNVHTIVLSIPLSELGGDQQVAGVWATTSRQKVRVLSPRKDPGNAGKFIQVARQGNPLFNEGLVPIVDKDKYSRQNPSRDAVDFSTYALNPELAVLLGAQEDRRTNRTDLASIFIPDLIKVDLSTGPARLAGGSERNAAPDDQGFHRLGIFGGDPLTSQIGNGAVPGGWPNGRRFGDDVVDIAVLAILSDLRTDPPQIVGGSDSNVDRVPSNDIGYNKVFPYAATPLNGRNHEHHGEDRTPPSE